MLDEIREQRFLACYLRIEGVLIAGARSQSLQSLRSFGGWGAASGGGGGRSPSLRASIQLWAHSGELPGILGLSEAFSGAIDDVLVDRPTAALATSSAIGQSHRAALEGGPKL